MAPKLTPATRNLIVNILTLLLGLLGGSSVSLLDAPLPPPPAPACVCPPAPTAPELAPVVETQPSE